MAFGGLGVDGVDPGLDRGYQGLFVPVIGFPGPLEDFQGVSAHGGRTERGQGRGGPRAGGVFGADVQVVCVCLRQVGALAGRVTPQLVPFPDLRGDRGGQLLGLAVGGMAIRDPECVEKSFPGFWEALYREGLL